MSYHRGGPSGVVAVSYTTNTTMAPLSPSRRFSSGNSGTTTSGIGSTTTTATKYSCRTPGTIERSTYSSVTSANLMTSRKSNYLPTTRSVLTYSDIASVQAAGSKLPKYSSTSTSSASSTASSASSTASRDRNSTSYSSSSSSFTKDELSSYSPDNYVPRIHRDKSNSTLNGYCKSIPFSSPISSGIAELHGGDERDSYHNRHNHRRNYSFSNGLTSGSTTPTSTTQLDSNQDRWTTASNSRQFKRRNNLLSTVNGGHDQVDCAASTGEVNHQELEQQPQQLQNIDSDLMSNIHHVNVNNINVDNDDNNSNNNCNSNNNDHDNLVDDRRLRDNNIHHDNDDNNINNSNNNIINNHHNHPTLLADEDKSRISTIPSSPSTSSTPSLSPTNSLWISSDSSANESCSSSNTTTPLAPSPRIIISDFYSTTSTINTSSCTSGQVVSGGGSGDKRVLTWTKISPTNNDNTALYTNNNDQECNDDNNVKFVNNGIITASNLVSSGSDTLYGCQVSSVSIPPSVVAVTSSSAGVNVRNQWTTNGNTDKINEDGMKLFSSSIAIIDGNINASESEDINSIPSSDISIEKIYLNDVPLDDASILGTNDHDFKAPTVGDGGGSSDVDENSRVTQRPTGTQDDTSKPSTSQTYFGGWDSLNNEYNATSTSNNTNQPITDVHQTIYRGFNNQIEESSTSRSPRNRIPARRDESHGLNGLRNIGNTCFMNSVIQCLSNTRPLLEYLLNEHYLNDINTTTSSMKGALIKAFAQVIHELWGNSGDHAVNTASLKNQIQRFAPRFMGYAQQDAQEFLRYLLEGLHEDVNRVTVKPQPILTDIPDHYGDSQKAAESWKRYLRSEDSMIVDVFVGQLRSSLHCTSCDHDSVTLDPFWDLSLPIPVRSGTVKLQQCLEHFTKVETLDGDEKPTCSKCQMRRKCTKSFSIQKFPKILVIHLKRFSPTERFRAKLSVLVDFPLEGLDLSAFAAPGVPGCTYNLYGVANHSGTPYSGHYTAYCKHPYSGEWHEYNDSSVSSVSQSSVISSEAYVLFYEQQSLSHHL